MIRVNTISNNKSWRNYIKNPQKLMERKVLKINKNFKKYKKKIFFYTLLLSGDNEIKKLNKKFRKKNKTTDVLSFPFYTKQELQKTIIKEKEIYLGDIIINFNKIKNRLNRRYFIIEFDKLWIHGLVHLFGYEHKKEKDFYNMKKFEKKLISYLD